MRPLLDLQRVDLALDRLRQRKADLPEQRALDDLTRERGETQKASVEKQEAFDKIAHEQTRLETEVSTIEEKVSHESARLYSGDISSPKELAAIQAELDGLRRRKNHIEDQLLDVLEEREQAEAELGAITTKLSELDAKIVDATSVRDTASVEIENELSQNEAARGEILPRVPEEALELYGDLRPKKNGVAVAALEGSVCRGCGVSLSPLALDQIKRSDDLVRCENCRRILIPA
ncbi:MAG: C4-type zinc ribbon domain-containing protein [Actinobacteria bacterium]|nr:C4-type zinc ribbon domain-containing protein [Actinomycetota bacterium]